MSPLMSSRNTGALADPATAPSISVPLDVFNLNPGLLPVVQSGRLARAPLLRACRLWRSRRGPPAPVSPPLLGPGKGCRVMDSGQGILSRVNVQRNQPSAPCIARPSNASPRTGLFAPSAPLSLTK